MPLVAFEGCMHRRAFVQTLGGAIIGSVGAQVFAENPQPRDLQLARVKVIDASIDVTQYVNQLHQAGIIAVGRYYGRPAPAGGCLYPEKLLTARELQAIEAAGLSVFTVFQHCANRCSHFRESYRKGIEDASAAIHGAHLLGQPKGTPIYFAVDFDPTPSTCDRLAEDDIWRIVIDYFRQLNQVVRQAGWIVGVYGAGATCAKLRSESIDGIPLAEFFWLSASVGHKGHADFFRDNDWHIYQNKVDIHGIDYVGAAFELDTDLTNPKLGYFGQWRTDRAPAEMPRIDAQTAQMILAKRAFIKRGAAIFQRRTSAGALQEPYRGLDLKGLTARVIEEFTASNGNRASVAVNLFENEAVDGYLYRDDLVVGLSNGMPT